MTAAVSLAACDKGKGQDKGGSAGGAAAVSAKLGGVDRILAALPMDSEVVFSLDYGSLRSNELIRPLIEKAANSAAGGVDLKAQCGLDPMTMEAKMVIGFSSSAKEGAGAISGMPRSKLLPCIEKQPSEQGVTRTIDGNYVMMTSTDMNVGMYFADEDTMFAVGGQKPVDKAALDKMAATKAGQGLTGSAQFMDMIKTVDTKATMWFLARGNGDLAKNSPVKFQAAFGSIDLKNGVDAKIRIRMTNENDAKTAVTGFLKDVGQIKDFGMATKAEARAEGTDAIVEVVMTNDHVKALTNFVKPMMEGLLNQMGGIGGQ